MRTVLGLLLLYRITYTRAVDRVPFIGSPDAGHLIKRRGLTQYLPRLSMRLPEIAFSCSCPGSSNAGRYRPMHLL